MSLSHKTLTMGWSESLRNFISKKATSYEALCGSSANRPTRRGLRLAQSTERKRVEGAGGRGRWARGSANCLLEWELNGHKELAKTEYLKSSLKKHVDTQ